MADDKKKIVASADDAKAFYHLIIDNLQNDPERLSRYREHFKADHTDHHAQFFHWAAQGKLAQAVVDLFKAENNEESLKQIWLAVQAHNENADCQKLRLAVKDLIGAALKK